MQIFPFNYNKMKVMRMYFSAMTGSDMTNRQTGVGHRGTFVSDTENMSPKTCIFLSKCTTLSNEADVHSA